MMGFYCAAQFGVSKMMPKDGLPPESVAIFEDNEVQVIKNTVNLFAWISRRHNEVMIFQYLQDASNRLDSCSVDELSEIAKAFLEMLSIGAVEMCNVEHSFLVSMNITY